MLLWIVVEYQQGQDIMGKTLKAYDYLCCSCYPKLTGGEGSHGYASAIFQALIPSPCFTS